MTITSLPSAPLPTDNATTFNIKAFSLLGALDTFVDEANETAVAINADKVSTTASKVAAASSAAASSSSASASDGSAIASQASSESSAASASGSAISALSAAASAASAATILDNFDDRYLGSKTSDPGLDNDGNALVTGALYFNSTVGSMKVFAVSGWINASTAAVAAFSNFEFLATLGQTVFIGNDANGVPLSYTIGATFLTLNGVMLRPGDDYTATNSSSITLTSAAALNDEILIYSFGNFLVADTFTRAEANARFATTGKAIAMSIVFGA